MSETQKERVKVRAKKAARKSTATVYSVRMNDRSVPDSNRDHTPKKAPSLTKVALLSPMILGESLAQLIKRTQARDTIEHALELYKGAMGASYDTRSGNASIIAKAYLVALSKVVASMTKEDGRSWKSARDSGSAKFAVSLARTLAERSPFVHDWAYEISALRESAKSEASRRLLDDDFNMVLTRTLSFTALDSLRETSAKMGSASASPATKKKSTPTNHRQG